MAEPIISQICTPGTEIQSRMSAVGQSFSIHEWRGSGPPSMHVHYQDDEAWHVLEGILKFRFEDREVEVGPGGTVFVPAGVTHTYEALNARYFIILTPRLEALIKELQQAPDRTEDEEIYLRHESELVG
ncbi:MAG: cupin domain-containing protein [Chthonomonadales bacterium]